MNTRSTGQVVAITGVAALALGVFVEPAQGQTEIESAIQQHAATQIPGYVRPLADVLVANLSRGYVTSMPVAGKFSFSFELVSMMATITDELRVYTANTPPGFNPGTYEAPTVFGGASPTVNHSTIPGLSYTGPDGVVNLDYFPTAAPQLRLGGILGTEVVFRYTSSSMVPFLDEEDFPKLTNLGIGVQHSLSRYLKGLPIDLSVTGSVNSLTFGDMIDLSSTSFGLNVGKSFGFVGVSGGVASEGGTMELTYTSTDPGAPGSVDVDLDVKRATRFRAGASFNMGFVRVFGDAAFGDVTSYAAGFRFGF